MLEIEFQMQENAGFASEMHFEGIFRCAIPLVSPAGGLF